MEADDIGAYRTCKIHWSNLVALSNVVTRYRWSVSGQSVRTNNDVEGWHNRLKNRAHKDMSFYRLIETLERESRWTSLSCRLVSESKLCGHQRQKYRRQQGRYCDLWRQYDDGEIGVMNVKSVRSHQRATHLNQTWNDIVKWLNTVQFIHFLCLCKRF